MAPTYDSRRLSPALSLEELLDRHHIQLGETPVIGRTHGGARSKLFCPQCHGGKEREKNFFVTIDRDGFGAVWICHRANNCAYTGGGRLKGAPERPQWVPKVYRRPTPEPNPKLPDKTLDYFAAFGISDITVKAFALYVTLRDMPVIDPATGKQIGNATAPRSCLAYPYYDQGELVNIKYKTVYPGGQKRFKQEWNTRRSLFNVDSLDAGDDIAVLVEGEDDVLAVYEAGWKQVVTLPDGTPSKIKPIEQFDRLTDDDQRYIGLYGDSRIDGVKRWILAGDMDEAGRRHHEEIARRLGKERCWQVRWPGNCKDAKQTLKERGIEAVHHALDTALPYPMEGAHEVTDEQLTALYNGISERRVTTGYAAIDSLFCLNDAGSLIVTTGQSGRGKTTAWNALSVMYAERNEQEMQTNPALRPFHTIVCSAEMKPDVMASRLIAAHAGAAFHATAKCDAMPLTEALETASWVRRHFTFIRYPDRSVQPTITWLMQRIREQVRRTSAKLVIVDPWQEYDDEMPLRYAGTPSKWIGVVLQRFVGLSVELSINIAIIVHPTKLRRDKDGKLPIPEGDDIADSVMFKSRCDIGMTVHRADLERDQMLIRIWKMKDERFARYGDTLLRYDSGTYRLFPLPVEVDLLNTEYARSRWGEN